MSSDDQSEKECPLCMEPLELDDINFYPCKCEYQICRFCWHRIRTDENGLCPACRQPYPEDPVNFKPLSTEELQKIKSEKKQKQQQQRQKMSESRKHLANYRVLQKNLVYVVGLSPRVAEPETLKKSEYFGKYGRIHKVVVGTTGTGAQSSSCTAYLTYYKAEDALRAIQAVNNVQLDGRVVKASLGTTKYCSSFLRNQQCHKQECMYLHEVADMEVSFTKDDMHQGRHADYERRLAEQVLNCVVDQKHHRRSPKLKGRDQQTADGDAAGHRQSRNHNAPPRHRNKQTSKSVERSAPKPVHHPHHRTCSNHSLSKEAALGEQASPATSNPQTGESTPAQMVGSVPNESSSLEQDTAMRMSVDQRDWNGPVSRLLTWTQTGASSTTDSVLTGDAGFGRSLSPSANGSAHSSSMLRGGTCDSVEKAQFMCNGFDRVTGDPMQSMCGPPGDDLSQTTDWQAAFGLKPMMGGGGVGGGGGRARVPSLSDDDLGFDPFSESSKGLADLLEQEKLEQKERQQQRELRERHASYESGTAPSSAGGPTGSYAGWNLNGRQSSPFVMSGASWDKPSSSFSQQIGMVRPHGSPIPQQFTTPPPSLPGQMPNGQFDGSKHYHNGGFGPSHELSNGMRGFGSHGMQHPTSLGFPPPGLSIPPPSHQRPLSPHDQSAHSSSMTEWQEGLKALLPNVNVHFAPELHSPGAGPKQSPSNGPIKAPNRNWMRHPPPMPPFTQPPPPLSVSTTFGGPPTSSMRPSPTGAPSDPFSHHPINGPTSRPPPGYPPGAPWQSVTPPPPPGFSPGSGKR